MELIKHNDPKYGFFVGYRPDPKGIEIVPQPTWQPDEDKARQSFKDYLVIHPNTTIEKEMSVLDRYKRFHNKLSVFLTW